MHTAAAQALQVVAMAAAAEREIGSRQGAWRGWKMLAWNRDIATRQPRNHFQTSLTDQKFTMIIDGNPCGFRAIISIETGFDEAIEVPNRLSIDREGDLLGFQGVDVACHSCDRSAIRMAKECHKNSMMASERFKLIENFSAAGWKSSDRSAGLGLAGKSGTPLLGASAGVRIATTASAPQRKLIAGANWGRRCVAGTGYGPRAPHRQVFLIS